MMKVCVCASLSVLHHCLCIITAHVCASVCVSVCVCHDAEVLLGLDHTLVLEVCVCHHCVCLSVCVFECVRVC